MVPYLQADIKDDYYYLALHKFMKSYFLGDRISE